MTDIVDTAVSAGSFNTLVAAVKAANLVDTLKGPGPFTEKGSEVRGQRSGYEKFR